MSTPAPQRPFWKRKRWIAAAVIALLLLLLAYPASAGPAAYAIERGWIDQFGPVSALWSPLVTFCERTGRMPHYIHWCQWWTDLAQKHIASE